MDFTSDADFRARGIERWVLELLAVPPAPEPPEGSPESIRIFRAGDQYYVRSVLVWASRCLVVFALLATVSVAFSGNESNGPRWIQIALASLVALGWIVFAIGAFVTFIARRLNYRLRWYIVTDRSLRIRSGVFRVDELTMTYGNIQEIRVEAGPLQHLLGLADVQVQAAGGGGDKKGSHGHMGRFEGLSNANAIRDLIRERVRHYRDSGLGEALPPSSADERNPIGAAQEILEEARALRAALSAR